MLRLKDKVIVISGGTKGVGKAAAVAFAKEGARVAFGGRDDQAAEAVLANIRACGSQGAYIHTDLHAVEDCKKLFEQAYAAFGRIDGFFNYAGVTPVSPLETCDEATFDEVMNVNYKACFFCCQQAVRYMKEHGGSIVLTGSAHAWGGQKDRAAYACSKGVLLTLSEHIAHHYASQHIRCNYLTLGWTPTEGELRLRSALGESEAHLRARAAGILPMGRMCEVTDFTEALILLMSDQSSMMTGSVFRVTAGEYI